MAKGTVHLCVGIYDRLETAEELGAALGEHEVALAVVGDAALPEHVEQVLAGAKRRIAKELDLSKDDLGEAMQGQE